MNKISINILFKVALIVCLVTLTSCGSGGGGGGSFSGAAQIRLTTSPNTIDTDDRTQVTVRISRVIDSGVVLKVRYSNRLSFAANTARLKLISDETFTNVEPNFTGERNDWKYLVFMLPRSMFGDFSSDEEIESETAELTLQLIGNSRLNDGRIEADADVNDPSIPDNEEFDINNPKFEAESEASIVVTQSRD
jgi:hypothetical protein